ncbi:unnamed protein product [Rangifer tarandus platyrhynchus]|uniref:Uncharacterized protein n=1 Tax=Rangifer tarandus platyrhynchus TaxID=3082113 RepID=A0AC59ZIC3_RANTA
MCKLMAASAQLCLRPGRGIWDTLPPCGQSWNRSLRALVTGMERALAAWTEFEEGLTRRCPPLGQPGPPALTHGETEAPGRPSRPLGQQGPRRGGGAPGPRSPRRPARGRRMGGDPRASPGARPPLGGAHGAREAEAAAAAAAAGGAGASAQPRPRPLPASPPLDNRSGGRACGEAGGGEGRGGAPGAQEAGPGARRGRARGEGAQEAGEAGRGRRRRRPRELPIGAGTKARPPAPRAARAGAHSRGAARAPRRD